MRTRIKICGITRLEDARYCAAAGVDYLGFILAAGSPRAVDPHLAREIVNWVYGPLTVGVFRDQDVEFINRVARDVGFDLVQLHGSETPEQCRAVEPPVIKAIAINPSTSAADLEREVQRYRSSAKHLLFDTSIGGTTGGTGKPFDWQVAAAQVDPATSFVAGGIGPENVREVIAQLEPFAVDVSSGVEESPGVKSFERINALLDAVGDGQNSIR